MAQFIFLVCSGVVSIENYTYVNLRQMTNTSLQSRQKYVKKALDI